MKSATAKGKKNNPSKMTAVEIREWAKAVKKSELIEYLAGIKEKKEIDLSEPAWGHQFTVVSKNDNCVIVGAGHYGGRFKRNIVAHDVLLLPIKGGGVGRFLVLNVRYIGDPDDLFHAYIVGVE